MKLDELLDSKHKWDGKFHHRLDGGWKAEFEDTHENAFEVVFSKWQGAWEVEFTRNEEVAMTGTGDAHAIFGTVVEVINAFTTEKKPEYLYFSAKSNEPSRVKFYKRLVTRLDGWKAGTDEEIAEMPQALRTSFNSPSFKTFFLVRK